MATTTLTIPQQTISGTHTYGPVTVPAGDTLAAIVLDRTVAGGLNSKTSALQMTLTVEESEDSGSTWPFVTKATAVGGTYSDPESGLITQTSISVSLYGVPTSTSRRVRSTIVVTGGSVTVAGSITIS